MTINRAQIPIIPTDSIRVAVKVDRKIYRMAKNLNIDIHTLWRMTLQEAVDALKNDSFEEEYTPHPQDDEVMVSDEMVMRDSFLKALVESQKHNLVHPSPKITEAAEQAKGPYPDRRYL